MYVITFGIVAYTFVGQPFSKQLYMEDKLSKLYLLKGASTVEL